MARPLLLALLALVSVLGPAVSRADEPERPALPKSRVQYFDSDPTACKPENIKSAFQAHLQPWADQSPEVLARLRLLQNDMTLASLRRCVNKGLLTREQGLVLFKELGLTLPAPPAAAQPATPP